LAVGCCSLHKWPRLHTYAVDLPPLPALPVPLEEFARLHVEHVAHRREAFQVATWTTPLLAA
jgi:hypothetical protein